MAFSRRGQTGNDSELTQNPVHKIRGGGFSVRARDSEIRRSVVVRSIHPARDFPESIARGTNNDDRDVSVTDDSSAILIGEESDCAILDRISDKLSAVPICPAKRNKRIAWPNLAGHHRQTRNLNATNVAVDSKVQLRNEQFERTRYDVFGADDGWDVSSHEVTSFTIRLANPQLSHSTAERGST